MFLICFFYLDDDDSVVLTKTSADWHDDDCATMKSDRAAPTPDYTGNCICVSNRTIRPTPSHFQLIKYSSLTLSLPLSCHFDTLLFSQDSNNMLYATSGWTLKIKF